ncbi:SLC23A2 (predicted) [Pycnogonum litorale]
MIPDVNVTDSYNITSDELYGKWNCPTEALLNLTNWTSEEIWQPRIREIQGAIILASFGEVIIGFSGLAGCILSKVTPLTVTPTVALVGLSLFKEAADLAGQNWPISVTTIALLLLFSEYLKNVKISLPKRLTRDKKLSSFPVFKIFPVILSISLIWLLCFILTVTNQFPADSSARTDRSNLISKSPWFRFPYPGQWGTPTFSIGAVFGMFSGVLAGIIESIGDYYACARLSGAPPPPVHAINRGISIEGLGCVLAGIWGSGNGTTSFSENIGVIGVTKVASRRVVQVAAVYLIWFACLSKVGAFFTTIPVPIVGGMFCVTFSMICAVGLSNLQYVNLNSTRNLLILGMSLFLGLAIPNWMKINKNVIQTGLVELDQIITVLLETSVFVGGFLGFVLDNTMPGLNINVLDIR